jgi:hypothetical protein
MHEETDDNGEQNRTDCTRCSEFDAQDPSGKDYGEYVDGRARIEESRGGSEARSHAIDAGEERKDGA